MWVSYSFLCLTVFFLILNRISSIELACQWRGFWKLGLASAKAAISTVRQFTTDQSPSGEYEPVMDSENEKSEVEEESRIAVWMWAPGVAALAVTAALFTCWQFSMSPVEAILALVFSFCMSLVAIQATGATGMLQPVACPFRRRSS